jgi:hypothetical protein
MAVSKATICDLCDLFLEFSMPLQLVREAMCAISTQVLSDVYRPLHGCTCGRQRQHFPNCVPHHDFVESHDQSKLLVRRSKRNDLRLVQRSHDEKVELNDDMEFEQILLAEQLRAMKPARLQILKFRQNLQPSQLDDLRQGSARDDLL